MKLSARAPVRICDNGGWTDTWFAGHGRVCHVAVAPFVQVGIDAMPRGALEKPVRLTARNYGETYLFDPAEDARERHPLLEAAIARIGIPAEFDCDITIHSDVPPGASTGTSAAACVALLAALDVLRGGQLTLRQLAQEAHAVETEMLGGQSGIQDQIAAAVGGINWIEMDEFPQARVLPLTLPRAFLLELQRRLALVYLGRAHSSSGVHQMVIRELEDLGPDNPKLEALRASAAEARDALLAQDLAAYGRALAENTERQAALHSDLVSAAARRVIEIAREYGAAGWKVNGAGGAGGSLAILGGGDGDGREAMLAAIRQEDPAYQVVPIRLSPGGVQVSVRQE
ncbi:MAG: GHMP kinase [Chloroflexi bacterium]|nr:GHMP kinase [Chloroflexota bacterium]